MEFIKIKADFKYVKNRLYRVMYVRPDITLLELGCVLVNAFGAEYEHYFLFKSNGMFYNPACFLEDYMDDRDLPLCDYKMSDLGNKFEFDYDTGDGWDFDITVYKSKKSFDIDEAVREELAFIVDGVGQGIWEDNISSLMAYFSGELKPSSKESKTKGYYFPWNFEIKKFGDFDNPLDLEEIQDSLNDSYNDVLDFSSPDSGYVTEDYLNGDDEPEVYDRIVELLAQATIDQIKSVPYMMDIYKDLSKEFYNAEALDILIGILGEYVMCTLKDKIISNEDEHKAFVLEKLEEYKKKIN